MNPNLEELEMQKKERFVAALWNGNKKKGEEYEPNSLRTIQNLFQSVSQ